MPSPSRLSTKPEKEMSVAAKKKADHQWTRRQSRGGVTGMRRSGHGRESSPGHRRRLYAT
eukprot:7305271-Prymnesium_polylepis.1